MEIGVDNKELFYEIKNESARILQLFIDTLLVGTQFITKSLMNLVI